MMKRDKWPKGSPCSYGGVAEDRRKAYRKNSANINSYTAATLDRNL